ncbi:MAG: hypothetical protein ACK553_14010 [Planctomycetota bacterium]|jgi:hypothetical protein
MQDRKVSSRFLAFITAASSLGWIAGCKPQEDVDRESAARAAAQAAAEAKPAMPDQKAGVGVGVQGRSLEGGSEYNPATFVSGPASAYFRTKEKIVFEIQIPHTLNAFVALNGRHPKSHEEYMREIIGNQIKLPKLPAGMVYRYHPDVQELWVESEKKDESNASTPSPPVAGDGS